MWKSMGLKCFVAFFVTTGAALQLTVGLTWGSCTNNQCDVTEIIYDGPAGSPHCHLYPVGRADYMRSSSPAGGKAATPADQTLQFRKSISSCRPECDDTVQNYLLDVWKAGDNGGTYGAWVDYGYLTWCVSE